MRPVGFKTIKRTEDKKTIRQFKIYIYFGFKKIYIQSVFIIYFFYKKLTTNVTNVIKNKYIFSVVFCLVRAKTFFFKPIFAFFIKKNLIFSRSCLPMFERYFFQLLVNSILFGNLEQKPFFYKPVLAFYYPKKKIDVFYF